ncbi:hypothetical protein PN498_25590 [Oscillatoria sp. CS-180]|uniref:hypothetical protein n=1 Tax=Oscillatoria sp. CS-180 TaxID=3021720 RepID=UPI00232BF689|nr:hypothetical protein [Oscillatoria sp. CS-180]MDB9529390.1 hypothetical protein [Oscillatoria sp. CS-180]
MSQRTAYQSRSISPHEQALYNHLLESVEQETPEQLINRFKSLFIDGVGYSDPEAVIALDQIVSSGEIEEYFHFILNRCCHILLNRWHSRPQLQYAVPLLIDVFDLEPCREIRDYGRTRQVRQLRQVVGKFSETEQYLTLKRLARLVNADRLTNNQNRPLGNLIQRYPYLYEHCLVSEGSPEEHYKNIRRIQAKAQRQFEVNLSQYVTYRVRQARLKRQTSEPDILSRLRPIDNPTLLSDRELVSSLNQFSGKVDHGRSYADSAQVFLQRNQMSSFGEFKRDLYEHLSASIDPAYGSRKFNKLLSCQLENIFPQNEEQQISDFLVIRTCSQLLNFMVLESPICPQHFVFIDLINNLGPLLATSLLLKVVLICRKIRPYLERRFSILFNHYEAVSQNNVEWLVKMFENLNVAFSVTFGSIDIASSFVV